VILNGFGLSLGDGIIGLQALFAAQTLFGGRATLSRGAGLYAVVDELYDLVDFADIRREDPSLARAGASEVIDLRDLAFDADFATMPMIDFFLHKLGTDPRTVPASLKRNTWLAAAVAPASRHGDIVLASRSSTPMRDWPDALAAQVLAADTRIRPLRRCADLAGLCAEVAGACAIISTDTAILHLADAFSVPCFALFTTHAPALRVRDYPHCEALQVPGFPAQLEFIRGPADLEQARAAWAAWMAEDGLFTPHLQNFLHRI